MLSPLIAFFSAIGLIYGFYQVSIFIIGTLKRPRQIPASDKYHRFAAIIPARNEEAVIEKLIKSLLEQDYPPECFDIYVIPNNCTDDTRGAALSAGAKILDLDEEIHSKGDVLNSAFKMLAKEDLHDAYLIFDADNLIDPGFVRAANDALAAGYQVGQGYRDSLNADDHWISGNSSEFFWFMNRLYNQTRFALNISAPLNGTGIMVGADAIRKIGWNTNSLTEDLEFTALCALSGLKICYMRNAVLYDEQPRSFRDSIIQRRRWTSGTIQCFRRYFAKLIKHALRNRSLNALDIALVFTGPYIQLIGMIPFIATAILAVREMAVDLNLAVLMAIQTLAVMMLAFVILCAAFVYLICALEKKWSVKRVRDMLTMPIFLASWSIINIYCLFTKPPRWLQIRHGESGQVTDHRARIKNQRSSAKSQG